MVPPNKLFIKITCVKFNVLRVCPCKDPGIFKVLYIAKIKYICKFSITAAHDSTAAAAPRPEYIFVRGDKKHDAHLRYLHNTLQLEQDFYTAI